ncbi:MAG: radical SAM protein [Nitrosomonadales bacterium]
MSLRPFTGEYLLHPVPLHLDLNWCSHACFYCFANLNQTERRTQNEGLQWLMKWKGNDTTLVGWLLANGYPIMVSNTADPLSASNIETFIAFQEICQAKHIPLCFQTKGGHKDHEAVMLDNPPTMIYISFTSDQEEFLKTSEPGAPSFQHRVELALSAKRQGHHVVLGINPMVPHWWDDFGGFCRKMADADIHHAWIGNLHLNYKQIANIPPKQKARFAKDIAMSQTSRPIDWEMHQDIEAAGIHEFIGYTNEKPGFWRDYYRITGHPFMPTVDGWRDYLEQESAGATVEFTFQNFDDWAYIGCDLEKSEFKDYLNGYGKSLRNNGIQPKAKSFTEVHASHWNWLDYKTPFRHPNFYLSCQLSPEGVILRRQDDDNKDVLIYAPGRPGKELMWNVDTDSPLIIPHSR